MLLCGGGGHAKVVLDCLLAANVPINGIFDNNPALKQVLGFPVIHTYQPGFSPNESLVIAVGNNTTRKRIAVTINHSFGTVMHPSALISAFATLGEGTVVFHQSVVQAGAQIGKHCIINTSASVDHDCVLEDFVHISPNATLSGNVTVGEGTHIGAGAVVIPGVTIGKWCVIGAGAVVIRHIPDFATAVGVPAKVIKRKPIE